MWPFLDPWDVGMRTRARSCDIRKEAALPLPHQEREPVIPKEVVDVGHSTSLEAEVSCGTSGLRKMGEMSSLHVFGRAA